MRHETIEKSAGLLGVLTAVAISLGGLAEIVPLIMSREAPTRSAMSCCVMRSGTTSLPLSSFASDSSSLATRP